MAYDVLNEYEKDFIELNADEIRLFANEQFAGEVTISKREVYQSIYIKLGGRQNICFTCGGSLKRLGKTLLQWL
jgi:hypothetical protein